MVGRALRGVKAGGTANAYIVSFIDNWNEHIAWVNPESLFEGSNDFFDKDPGKRIKRDMMMISVAKLEEFAKILDDTVDTTKLENVPFLERIPLGMYTFSYTENSFGKIKILTIPAKLWFITVQKNPIRTLLIICLNFSKI